MKSSYIAILANMLGAGVSYAQFSNTSISPSRPTCTQVSYQTEGALSCANNVPGNRSAWCDHSIDTDYTNVDNVPNTGITREYWLEVGQGYLSPEGSEARFVMTVNGTIPGPTIYADWGDEVVVHVKNNLTEELLNGTSIHWHGIRQYQTNQHDGVVSLTQCPIAPSKSMTYRWRAVQYGSSWYHSHLGLQAWEGVFGGIVINGPATANYDVDMGSLFLSDWTNQTVDTLYQSVREDPDFGLMNNGLINGTNTNLTGAGCPFVMKVDEGKSYQLRIVNAAMDTHWDFGIDNHTMKVIAMDFVPIEPFDTPNITIAMGQRYDVIVTANQASTADSFWMRALPVKPCVTWDMNALESVKGIIRYTDNATDPQTHGSFNSSDFCRDIPAADLVPHVKKDVPIPSWNNADLNKFLFVNNTNETPDRLYIWEFNSVSMNISWNNPTLLQVHDNKTTFPKLSNVIELPKKDEWTYLLINNTNPVTHPIHLHGHDFFVIAEGSALWDRVVTWQNPPRRDTATLQSSGYLVLAFQADNPGVWLMHCHIGWHINEGLSLQFVERRDEINIDYSLLNDTCDEWDNYASKYHIVQPDSGV